MLWSAPSLRFHAHIRLQFEHAPAWLITYGLHHLAYPHHSVFKGSQWQTSSRRLSVFAPTIRRRRVTRASVLQSRLRFAVSAMLLHLVIHRRSTLSLLQHLRSWMKQCQRVFFTQTMQRTRSQLWLKQPTQLASAKFNSRFLSRLFY